MTTVKLFDIDGVTRDPSGTLWVSGQILRREHWTKLRQFLRETGEACFAPVDEDRLPIFQQLKGLLDVLDESDERELLLAMEAAAQQLDAWIKLLRRQLRGATGGKGRSACPATH